MKIAIFTEGTILKHEGAIGHSRDKIVRQVKNNDTSVKNYASYLPIANAVGKIRAWTEQGAEIVYITSRQKLKEVKDIQNVLKRNNFPKGLLEYRKTNEEYQNVAERIKPDVLIEDDCESIGGKKETIHPHIRPGVKEKIHSITVKEFEGIDYLPDNIESLRTQG